MKRYKYGQAFARADRQAERMLELRREIAGLKFTLSLAKTMIQDGGSRKAVLAMLEGDETEGTEK